MQVFSSFDFKSIEVDDIDEVDAEDAEDAAEEQRCRNLPSFKQIDEINNQMSQALMEKCTKEGSEMFKTETHTQ